MILQKAERAEALMTVPSNHNVIVKHDAEFLHCFRHFARDLDIAYRQCWIARRMVVHQMHPTLARV